MPRRLLVLVLVPLVGCGGRVAGEEATTGTDAASDVTIDGARPGRFDANVDGGADTVIDVSPPSACGVGKCTAGATCKLDCNTCTCGASGTWGCTKIGCAGECPTVEPKVGDVCSAPGKCSYTSECGVDDVVHCDGSGTVTSIEFGLCPGCPVKEPTGFSKCTAAMTCRYTLPCGAVDLAKCYGGSSAMWVVTLGDCPP